MIGIIDSGFGGLSIIAEMQKQEKEVPFVYLGDNLNNPYGTKTIAELEILAYEMIDFLVDTYKIKHLIIACNTLVATVIDKIERRYPTLIIHDILSHGAIAATMSFSNAVAVIATKMTIQSHAYKQKIAEFNTDCLVQEVEAQSFVDYVESNTISQGGLVKTLSAIAPDTDMLILGCTHFPFLYDEIRLLIPEHIQLIDPAVSCVQQLVYESSSTPADSVFLTTGNLNSFEYFLMIKQLNKNMLPVQKVVIKRSV
ncbi:glutamate racemase [Erysipelotrichaceae bacterium]|nr:glutamate racemase [Erysipelotrichaceae bacterium]